MSRTSKIPMACVCLLLLSASARAQTVAFEGLGSARWGSFEASELGTPGPGSDSSGGPVVDFPALPPDWDRVIDVGGGSSVFFGIRIAGPAPYVRNAESRFAPASNSKLFTAAAALAFLGPEFTIETRLRWRPVTGRRGAALEGVVAELTLIGNGDPTWGMSEHGETLTSRFDQMARMLKERGVREVRGPVRAVAGDPRWEALEYPQGWSPDDRIACYGAQAQSFNLDINCGEFRVTGVGRGHWVDPAITVPVRFKVVSGSKTSLSAEVAERPSGVSKAFMISGTFARGSSPVSFILPVHSTRERVRAHLVAALVRAGIRVNERKSVPSSTDRQPEELVIQSPPLAEMLKPFMKLSLNHVGDALFKIMGLRLGTSGADLNSAGREVLASFVSRLGTERENPGEAFPPGAFSEQVVLHDGSGVSRSSLTTSAALMTLLEDALIRTDFQVLWESLPIAGVDGTLQNRMKGTAAEGVLRAKTGTLRGVYNLSGYVPKFNDAGGVKEYVPFVMLSATTEVHKDAARGAQDRVGATLAEVLR